MLPVPLAETAETFENVTPAVPAPLTLPALRDTAAPAPRCSALLPAPPSNETATSIAPTVRLSSPLPPVIASDDTMATGRVSVVPLRVTETSEPIVVIAMLFAPAPRAIDQGEAAGVGEALGEGDGLGSGDALGSGDGLAEGDALGAGDGVGSGDALGLGDALGDGSGVAEGDGSGVEEGEGSGVVDGDGSGVVDGDGGGGSVGLGEAEGVESSDIAADVGVQRLAIFDPIPCIAPAGAYVGAGVRDGAALGAGVADGLGALDGAALGFAVGAVVGAEVGDAIADGFTIGAVLAAGAGVVTGTRTGGCQSSGCTNVAPVAASYWMMRTPDSAAHAARLAASVGRSVML